MHLAGFSADIRLHIVLLGQFIETWQSWACSDFQLKMVNTKLMSVEVFLIIATKNVFLPKTKRDELRILHFTFTDSILSFEMLA